MAVRRPPLAALLVLGVVLSSGPLDAQRPLAPFPSAPPFAPVPQLIPPLHISGETHIRLREASFKTTPALTAPLQTSPPTQARSPDRIRRAVVMLTALAASAMVLLLAAAWLFIRRRQS